MRIRIQHWCRVSANNYKSTVNWIGIGKLYEVYLKVLRAGSLNRAESDFDLIEMETYAY